MSFPGVLESLDSVRVREGFFRQFLDLRYTDFGLAYGKHLKWVGISPKYVECLIMLLYAI